MAEDAAPKLKQIGFACKSPAKVDPKGRILLSKRNADYLGKDFVLTLKPEGCLAAYPLAWWVKYEAYLDAAPPSYEKDRFVRKVYGGLADENNLDEQYRLVIPSGLRRESGLEPGTDAVVHGVLDRIEIWRADEHAKYEADEEYYKLKERNEMDRLFQALQVDHPMGKSWTK
jgi:division/cell wall cluster transcriptional repressor MraZ